RRRRRARLRPPRASDAADPEPPLAGRAARLHVAARERRAVGLPRDPATLRRIVDEVAREPRGSVGVAHAPAPDASSVAHETDAADRAAFGRRFDDEQRAGDVGSGPALARRAAPVALDPAADRMAVVELALAHDAPLLVQEGPEADLAPLREEAARARTAAAPPPLPVPIAQLVAIVAFGVGRAVVVEVLPVAGRRVLGVVAARLEPAVRPPVAPRADLPAGAQRSAAARAAVGPGLAV